MQISSASQADKPTPVGNVGDDDYHRFLGDLQARFLGRLARGSLFTTDAAGLWETYLESFPVDGRQFHNCNSCRRFVETYGGLVTIDEDGRTSSAVWDSDPYERIEEGAAVAAMAKVVRRAKVTGVFLSKEPTWGYPLTGVWRHMSVTPPKSLIFTERALTAGQAMAEKREDHKNVSRSLAEYPMTAVHQALALLKSDALYRAEKVLGPCQFLADLHASVEAHKAHRANVIWRAIATAPAGFCHPRSSMIGTLLDDIVAGVDFAEASRRFREKMHPLQYQRPTAAPSAGNIAAAEALVEKLGIGPSLERRFARLDEIETIWRPAPAEAPATAGGVFGHLKAKGAAPSPSMNAPAQTMTWVKFAESVLPDATAIELRAPWRGNYTAILTANNPDAPPILQWDLAGKRNPFSAYVYHGGSAASDWGLPADAWVKVDAVAENTHQWFGGNFPHQGAGVVLILNGAKDSRTGQGNALFPETLKAELHGVRSTIEAYSKNAAIHGREEASACGLSIRGTNGGVVRVTDRNGIKSEFRIDRFE